MADEAVRIVLNYLKELQKHHSDLLTDHTRTQIASIQGGLGVFKEFLNDSWEKRSNHDAPTETIVQNIIKVVNEVEDDIDTFVNQAMAKHSSISLFKSRNTPVDLDDISQKVKEVKARVDQARVDIGIAKLSVEDELKSLRFQERPPKTKCVVGFEDEAEFLINRLKTESDYLEVISLIGMPALGKTTLARKVFNDPAIIQKFPLRIWHSISQEFSDRDIFLSILSEFTTLNQDIRAKEDYDLADMVLAFLNSRSFLIAFDDVWEISHWHRLRVAIPFHNNCGKVLITSRNDDVGKFASHPNPVKRLRSFSPDESWELLRQEALGTLDCPPNLEKVGQTIAHNCMGQPLALALIGGILATKSNFSDMSAVEKEWEKISTQVSAYVREKSPENLIKDFISLIYYRLPPHLRSCFLYFGSFPESFDIPVSTLIRLWIGEGFIPHINDFTLEETAEKYLEELINMNLVQSGKLKYNGKIKTCWVHGILRDFCSAEAARENLAKEIKCTNGIFSPPVPEINNYHRLSIHSNCLNFIASKPYCPRVRSLVCFSKDEFALSEEYSSKIVEAFKSLKVFDGKPLKFPKISRNMYHLVYMRYLALSCNFSVIPSKLSQFWNLQTLIIDTTSHTLEVKADIWEMSKLRYFKTNASATLPKPSKRSKHGKELQTLGTISEESCTAELFNQARNLKKLGIRGRLLLFLQGKVGSFDSLAKMQHIEKLKLINDLYPNSAREEPQSSLPQPHQFPSGLTTLTLSATSLSWDVMPTLGSLQKLKVLKLRKYAFMGITWNAVHGGFQCLELLHIEDTDLTVWNASSDHYPHLRGLVLRNCEKLIEIPIGLAGIKSLHMLELRNCKSAAASAMKIKEAKTETQGDSCALTFSVYPR